jgi:hypothetical protein
VVVNLGNVQGTKRRQPQAISIAIARTWRLPALLIPAQLAQRADLLGRHPGRLEARRPGDRSGQW